MALLGNFSTSAWFRKARDGVGSNGSAEQRYSSLGFDRGSASNSGAYPSGSPLKRFAALWSRKRITLLVLTVVVILPFLLFSSGVSGTP